MEMNDRELRGRKFPAALARQEKQVHGGPCLQKVDMACKSFRLAQQLVGDPLQAALDNAGEEERARGIFEITLQAPVKIQCDNALLSGTYWN